MESDGYSIDVTIEVTAYRNLNGTPTCAIDFTTGHVCKFYRSIGIQGYELCGYTEDHLRRDVEEDGNFAYGYLVPCSKCPIHHKKEDRNELDRDNT